MPGLGHGKIDFLQKVNFEGLGHMNCDIILYNFFMHLRVKPLKMSTWELFIFRRNIFYVGGLIANISQSALYFMDLTSKSGWVLQTGKMNPPGLLGKVRSNFFLEESFLNNS